MTTAMGVLVVVETGDGIILIHPDALPAIVPIRVANQRALAAYLAGEDLS